jgi:hypothetical protein
MIEQLVKPGEVAMRSMLPSSRYQASWDELTEADVQLPWPSTMPEMTYRPVVGELARSLGAKTRGRLIASAKSWLSHTFVDRGAPILPWGAAEDAPKISPVEASASFLRHVRSAWNFQHPEALLEDQDIVVTVPASFDEVARTLTLEAARLAGIPRLRLLEEPQAVCYDWLWQNQPTLQKQLAHIRLLLVCDVGGGTTDLTLIKVEPGQEEPRLSRIAVGDHLILGGDNIDLTLAHVVEQRIMGPERKLSTSELSQLIEQCRVAKERLLEESAPELAVVTLLGSGAKLIGGARSAELTRDEVHRIVLDGFFPLVTLKDHPDRKRSGVVEFGLPYAADPAMSKHLAVFLSRHRQAAQEALQNDTAEPVPDAILVNGGVFRSPIVVQRLLDLLGAWSHGSPRLLHNDRPDLAVACGAVAYGMARRGYAIQRIGGGSARSYFLLVETADSEVSCGVCILPRGTEEGREILLTDRTFLLRLGKPVRFHLVSSLEDRRYQAGELTEVDDERFAQLPPLAVAFDREMDRGVAEQRVQIVASLTEIGTLDLQCLAVDGSEWRWQVEFQLRQPSASVTLAGMDQHPRLDLALEKIRLVFGKKTKELDPKSVRNLRSELEKTLGGRDQWNTLTLRELFNALLEGLPRRRRSAEHERLWFSLTGYCLRPGYGYPLDDWRVEQVFAIYEQGVQFTNEVQNWAEWWTLWRRVAGGLSEYAQVRIFEDLAEFLSPEKAKRGTIPTLIKKRSYEDMVRLAGVLERLPVQQKTELGGWLLQRLVKPSEPVVSWWCLGRVGSRVPLHGSIHNVVPKETAEAWLLKVLEQDFKEEPSIGFATALIARRSGDRERDIDAELRQRVIGRLRTVKAPDSWISMVSNIQELTEADEKRIFGEALPPGLKLLG